MSAVAAVAVASPFAVTAVTALTASPQPAPEKHDFVQAAMVTDLPGEIVSALQSSLSQFGIVVPNIPSGILRPSSTPASSSLPSPGGLTATPGTMAAPALGPHRDGTGPDGDADARIPAATTPHPVAGVGARRIRRWPIPGVPVTPPARQTLTASV